MIALPLQKPLTNISTGQIIKNLKKFLINSLNFFQVFNSHYNYITTNFF